MKTQARMTVFVTLLGILAGVLAVVMVFFQGDQRVEDAVEPRDDRIEQLTTDLAELRADNGKQRTINAEQALLIDELLVSRTPEQQAAAIESSRRRLEDAGVSPRPSTTTTRPTGTTASTTTTTTTRPSEPPPNDDSAVCVLVASLCD